MKTRKLKNFCENLEIKTEDLFFHENIINDDKNVDIINFNPNFFNSKLQISLVENEGVVCAVIIYPVEFEESLDLYRLINDYNNKIVGSNFTYIENYIVFKQQIGYHHMSGYEVIEALSEFNDLMLTLIEDINFSDNDELMA